MLPALWTALISGAPVWIDTSGAPLPEAELLLQVIEGVTAEGLEPEDYHRSFLSSALAAARARPLSPDELETLDAELNDAFITLYAHQHGGRVDPVRLRRRTLEVRERTSIGDRLARASEEGELAELLATLEPSHPDYAPLKALLAEYRALAREAPAHTAIHDRALQIELNLEARRWMPAELGERYVLVNVAAATLSAYRGSERVLDSRVIVGKRARKTPLFSSTITGVVAHPEWWVPRRIAVEELLPAAQRDPSTLAARNFRVLAADGKELDPSAIEWSKLSAKTFPYRFVQGSGEANALGAIKLSIPNPYSVYLHDTPTRTLFERDTRTLSHGCVRVERAAELAAWVLGPAQSDAWNAALASPRTITVPVADPPSVHLVYWTVSVEPDGTFMFHRDVYGRDAALAGALDSGRARGLPDGAAASRFDGPDERCGS